MLFITAWVNERLRSAVRRLGFGAVLAMMAAGPARADRPPDLFLPYSERYNGGAVARTPGTVTENPGSPRAAREDR